MSDLVTWHHKSALSCLDGTCPACREKARIARVASERDAAYACLLQLVQAIECAWEDDPDSLRDLFDHYAHARAVIGRPVTYHAGGEGGEHFHFLKMDEGECGECDLVAQTAAERAEAAMNSSQ